MPADEQRERHTPEQGMPEETILQPASSGTVGGGFVAPFAGPEEGLFGRFKLLERLGSGGMGVVYRGLHVKLQKTVALKVLPAERMRDPQAVARFLREISLVGRLAHRNIVRFENTGEADGQHYLVMEYVPGADLARLVEALGPLLAADACQLIGQAAVGLDHIHRAGLVHRDIKPSNLILALDGTLKIVDLGLARLCEGDGEELTLAGQGLGTAAYVAPEQAAGGPVDLRADVYSLGCTLFHLLAGVPPFHGPPYAEHRQLLLAHVRERPPALGDLRADVPEGLSALVGRMLAKSPSARPQTPAEVAKLLLPYAAGCRIAGLLERLRLVPAAPSAGHGSSADTVEYLASALASTQSGPIAEAEAAAPPPPSPRRALRRPAWLAAIAAAIVAIVVLGIAAVQWNRGRNASVAGGGGDRKPPSIPPPDVAAPELVALEWATVGWPSAATTTRTFAFDDLHATIALDPGLQFDSAVDSPSDGLPATPGAQEQSLLLAWTWTNPAAPATVNVTFSEPVAAVAWQWTGGGEALSFAVRAVRDDDTEFDVPVSGGPQGVSAVSVEGPISSLVLECAPNAKAGGESRVEVRLGDLSFTAARPFGGTHSLDWDQLDWRRRAHTVTTTDTTVALSLSGDRDLGGLPVLAGSETGASAVSALGGAAQLPGLAWRVQRTHADQASTAALDFSPPVAELTFDVAELDAPADNFADRLTVVGTRAGMRVPVEVTDGAGKPVALAEGAIVARADPAPQDGRATVRFAAPVDRVMLAYEGELPAGAVPFDGPRPQQIVLGGLRFRPRASDVAPPASVRRAIVPATADVWLAGLAADVARGGEREAVARPVELRGLPLDAGGALVFEARGTVRLQPGPLWRTPAGALAVDRAAHPPAGVGAARLPAGALVGVFLGDRPAEVAVTGPHLGLTSPHLIPRLGEVFPIGGGRDPWDDAPRQVFVPPDATRLFLGVMDDGAYDDNVGRYDVDVSIVPPGRGRLTIALDAAGREVAVNGVRHTIAAGGQETIGVLAGGNVVIFDPDGTAPEIRTVVVPAGETLLVAETPSPRDVLSRIVPERDAIGGTLATANGGIDWSAAADERALLQLPLVPPAEYALEVEVERTGAGAFGIGAPVPGGQCLIVFDALDENNGRPEVGLMNSTNGPLTAQWSEAVLAEGAPTLLSVRVGLNSVRVSAGERLLLDWQGDPSTLKLLPDEAAPYSGVPFLENRAGSFRIERLGFVPLSGPPRPAPVSSTAPSERLLAERVLWKGGTVRVVGAGGTSRPLARLEELPPAPRLAEIAVAAGGSLAMSDADLLLAADATELRRLDLLGSSVTAAGLVRLPSLGACTLLRLSGTPLDDGGIATLAPLLTDASYLCLCATSVTGAGLRDVARLTKLQELHLGGLDVADTDLDVFAAMPQLKRLRLVGTKTTEEGRKRLQQARPDITLLE